jgi:hypothetical protein
MAADTMATLERREERERMAIMEESMHTIAMEKLVG